MKNKLCIKCKEIKNINEFAKNKTEKDGLQKWCKKCKNEYNKKYRIDNKAKIKEYHKIKDRERYLKIKKKYWNSIKFMIIYIKKKKEKDIKNITRKIKIN